MVNGLDTFSAYFAGDEPHYVLIGGVATQLALEEAGLNARATKDLDIVLCIEALNPTFGEKLWAFIDEGGYQVRQRGEAPRRFYRFAKPNNERFPFMLEFFARAPGHFPLEDGAHLTPVPIGEAVASLSAILLDDDYYRFLHSQTRRLRGVHVVTERALIPLKSRAWLDLTVRRGAGEEVSSRDTAKHRNDVLRLSQLLVESDPVAAPEAVAMDMGRFVSDAGPEVTRQLLDQLGIDEAAETLLARLRAIYGAQA